MTNQALVAGASLHSHADQLPPGQTRWSAPLSPPLSKPALVRALARSFLNGEASVEQVVERAAQMLGRNWRWLGPVARRYIGQFAQTGRPARRSVIAFLLQDESVDRAWRIRAAQLTLASRVTGPAAMQPVPAAAHWPVSVIDSVGALAQGLGLNVSDLEWLSDLKRLGPRSHIPQLQHYHYRVLAKQSGTLRLIEAPKTRLKSIQRQILRQILEQVPLHSAVHGFAKGRSIKTFASLHAGRRVVLRMDLCDFFPSIQRARVQALFRTMGYPESVANLLGGLCTSSTPKRVWRDARVDQTSPGYRDPIREVSQLYARPHLPQGAPTTPRTQKQIPAI